MISVIVPVYNCENVLHYCIDSILNQTYKDFELILVDDGSTDKSGKICDEYADQDSRIRVFHKKNGGVSSARNVGIDNAKGEYICFVDSDDFVSLKYIETLLEIKKRHQDIDNIWCSFRTVDSYNVELSDIVIKQSEMIFNRIHIMDLHDKRLDAGPVCKLYSYSIIDKFSIRYDETISLGEDLLFNYQYLDCTNGKIILLSEGLYYYYTSNKSSLTQKFHNGLFEKYTFIHQRIREYLSKWNCDNNQTVRFNNACFFIYDFVLRNTYHTNSSIKHRATFNRQIMKSSEFQTTLKNTDCYIHPIYKMIYRYKLAYLFGLLIK